jgi:hypothetical protein
VCSKPTVEGAAVSNGVGGGGAAKPLAEGKRGLIIAKEAHAQGNPKLSLYVRYFKYCGGLWFGVTWAVLSLLWQGLTVAQSFYLKEWVSEYITADYNPFCM